MSKTQFEEMKKILFILTMASWSSVHAAVINLNMVNHQNGPTSVDGPFGQNHHHQRYINLQPYNSSVAHFPYAGGSWNNPLNGDLNKSPGSLRDSEGNVTQVGIGMSNLSEDSFTFSYGGSSTNTNEIKDNYLAARNSWENPVVITLSNLDREKTFDFVVYSQNGEGNNMGGHFVFLGDAGQTQESISAGTGRYTPDHIPGENLVVAEGIIPDEDGKIYILMSSVNEGGDAIINGLQIRSIPEPSTALLSLTALGMLFRRKRV